jgi:predicted nucleotidyltransferase component of viral defense system
MFTLLGGAMIDLSRRAALSSSEHMEISEILHLLILEEVFRHGDWKPGDAVFHGGTALHLIWKSDRYSEDLDFMLADDKFGPEGALIEVKLKRIFEGVKAKIGGLLPGSSMGIKGHYDQEQGVQRWMIGWQHPNRHGVVKVKLEFYGVERNRLKDYPMLVQRPANVASKLQVSTSIVAADLIGVVADKLLAVAQREYIKYRDIYDLHYAYNLGIQTRRFENKVAYGSFLEQRENIDNQIRAVFERVMALYTTPTIEEVGQKMLAVIDTDEFNNIPAFIDNMGRWMPEHLHCAYAEGGTYRSIHEQAKRLISDFASSLDNDYNRGLRR